MLLLRSGKVLVVGELREDGRSEKERGMSGDRTIAGYQIFRTRDQSRGWICMWIHRSENLTGLKI